MNLKKIAYAMLAFAMNKSDVEAKDVFTCQPASEFLKKHSKYISKYGNESYIYYVDKIPLLLIKKEYPQDKTYNVISLPSKKNSIGGVKSISLEYSDHIRQLNKYNYIYTLIVHTNILEKNMILEIEKIGENTNRVMNSYVSSDGYRCSE